MKRGKSISDWMTSALGARGDAGSSQKAPPTSRQKAPPTSSQRPRKVKRDMAHTEGQSLQGSCPVYPTAPLTAGTLTAETDLPWSTKYSPQSAAELAVHKKKVSEVETWLEYALTPQAKHPILLLTGPPGCGKTATIQALSKDLGFSVVEWVNPSGGGGRTLQERDSRPGDIVLYPESQWRQFQSFLVRANRYPGLQMVGVAGGQGQTTEKREKKVVLVEEFPNTFIRDPSRFHYIMSSLAPTLHYPLVLIVSESHSDGSSTSAIFSKAALAKMDIHTISFNPVAHTNLVKALQRIASAECQRPGLGGRRPSSRGHQRVKFHMPPKDVIESLAESSAGDIRSAINSLQFACLKDSRDLSSADAPHPPSSQRSLKRHGSSSSLQGGGARHRRRLSEAELSAIGGRDCSLFLFRALGRVLYCKRGLPEEGGEGVESSLPDRLKQHWRPPLLDDPELAVEQTHMSPDLFVLFLHQNYIDFFEDLDDIVRAIEYLSDADILGRLWTDSQAARTSLSLCGSSVACRGLMHSNAHRSTSGGKWRPLHKPQCLHVSRKYRENCQAVRSLFLHLGSSPHSHLWTPVELQTETLPYLAMINVPLRNHGQAALLQSVTQFTPGYHRSRPETLGEKDTEGSCVDQGLEMAAVALTAKNQLSSSQNQADQDSQSATEPHPGVAGDNIGAVGRSLSQDVGTVETGSGWSQDVQVPGQDDSDADIEDFDDDIIW